MNKKLILIMALVFVLSIGAGVGTMALYQKQFETNSNSVKAASFNPVVKTRLPNNENFSAWTGSHDFKNISIEPGSNNSIGHFKVNTKNIELSNNEYNIKLKGDIISEMDGSNLKINLYKNDNPTGINFSAKGKNEFADIKGDQEYTIYLNWPKPSDDQDCIWFRKNNNPDNEWKNKDENSNEYTNEDLYTWDAKYAGKTGEIRLEVQVNQK